MFKNLSPLLEGASLTLQVSILAIFLGLAIGVLVSIAAHASKIAGYFTRTYVSFIRGTPLFVQILVLYFILPGIGLNLSNFTAGVIVLGINSGAYISEMVRGALTAIPKGHLEAAAALALSPYRIWVSIILPQVFRLILPPLTVEFAAILKGSALLSIIGVVELTRSAQQLIAVTYGPTRVWVTVGVLYFVMCFGVGVMTRALEKYLSGAGSMRQENGF